jgi:hypothetical protein
VREIAAMLKAIHASEDIVAAREKAVRVIEKLRGLHTCVSGNFKRPTGESNYEPTEVVSLPGSTSCRRQIFIERRRARAL